MHTVIAKFKAKLDKLDEAKRTLYALVVPTLSQEGCLQYDLHQSNDEPGTFFVYENWADYECLSRHLMNDYNDDFRERSRKVLQAPMEIFLLKKV